MNWKHLNLLKNLIDKKCQWNNWKWSKRTKSWVIGTLLDILDGSLLITVSSRRGVIRADEEAIAKSRGKGTTSAG